MSDDIMLTYPCTIIPTRYGGVYEGGAWAAFKGYSAPDAATDDDVTCSMWWEEPTVLVGVGRDPNAAWDALIDKVEACEHPKKRILQWEDKNGLRPVECLWCMKIVDRVEKSEYDRG